MIEKKKTQRIYGRNIEDNNISKMGENNQYFSAALFETIVYLAYDCMDRCYDGQLIHVRWIVVIPIPTKILDALFSTRLLFYI